MLWWSQFRETFATEEDWKTITWNNKEIKVENKPVYYKHYVKARVICIQDLLFSLNSTDSYNQLSKKNMQNKYFRFTQVHSIIVNDRYPSINSPTFVVGDNNFDDTKGKSKDYYNLLIREKAKPTNIIQKLLTFILKEHCHSSFAVFSFIRC